MPDSLRECCEKRLAGLKSVRSPYEEDWKEIASYAQPLRSRFLNTERDQSKRRTNAKLRDNHGIKAVRVMTAGLTSGLASASKPWFTLETPDTAMMEFAPVKEWLVDVEQRMYAFLASTNFYGCSKTGFAEIGLFGTEAAAMVEHQVAGLVTHTLTAGEYWIACGDTLMPDTLYRRVPMSIVQTVQSFGLEKVSRQVRTAWDRSDYETVVNVFHAIEPNTERKPGYDDAGNKAWRSVWWDEGDQRADDRGNTLRKSGFDERPFWAARWNLTSNDTYGWSPGFEALPELRELQLQKKRKGEAVDYMLFPPKVVPTSMRNGLINTMPRGMTFTSGVDAAGISSLFEVTPQGVAQVREDLSEVRRAIDETFYVDLFMAITRMEGVQPRNVEEIARRYDEQLTQLGSVVDSSNREKLSVVIDRTFSVMNRAGLLPPPPQVLEGVPLKIVFVSVLTQMQRLVGVGAIERTASFVSGLMQAFPDAAHKFDAEQAIDEYARMVGAPPKIIRSDDVVEQRKAEAMQQQQMAQMAQMAPAMRDGAEAAKKMAEANAIQEEA